MNIFGFIPSRIANVWNYGPRTEKCITEVPKGLTKPKVEGLKPVEIVYGAFRTLRLGRRPAET
jgi:hypothetical protein